MLRTLQRRIHAFLTFQKSYNFFDRLQDVVAGYNQAIHSAHGLSPREAEMKQNHYRVNWEHAKKYAKYLHARSPPKFAVNQLVRIAFDRTVFSRSYNPQFTDTLYRISSVSTHLPITMYSLVSAADSEPILGMFLLTY